MFQYRQVLVRMRQGDTDRDIARARLVGRRKSAQLRALAGSRGWLDPSAPLPEDAEIAQALAAPVRASSTVSSLEAYRELITRWVEQRVNGVAIHAALRREHGYSGSYSAVYRMLRALGVGRAPQATVPLAFAPGEAAQVDFGAGLVLFDEAELRPRRTWGFVMTLCWSRHQYVEFVWDQTVAIWLGCHRRACEWFGAVPARLIIDNQVRHHARVRTRSPGAARLCRMRRGLRLKIDACLPADPQKKGIVEARVKYVKGNFLPTRSFRGPADLNVQARRWMLEEAGNRIHGTTRERPLERFAVEKPLIALPYT